MHTNRCENWPRRGIGYRHLGWSVAYVSFQLRFWGVELFNGWILFHFLYIEEEIQPRLNVDYL
jgi:hypothetical protein